MASFGEDLRRERELRQISLREVSEATKINSRYLDALERNDFRHLPGGVFNKGFVRAYAEYIGIDAEAMVNAYLLQARAASEIQPSTTPGAPPVQRQPEPVEARRERTARPRTPRARRARLVLIVLLVAMLALVGLLMVFLWLPPSAAAIGPLAGGAAAMRV